MKYALKLWSLTAIVFSLLPASRAANSAIGYWEGTIAVPPKPLAIHVDIAQAADKTWSGVIDLGQAMMGKSLSGVSVDGDAVTFALVGIPGNPQFTGTISADGSRLAGQFNQAGASFPFSLERKRATPRKAVEIVSGNRPQEPKRPYPYVDEEVRINNSPAGVVLAGTLTRPEGPGPFPTILLLSGYGAKADRDEAVLGHRPFLIIADQLTRHGYAVLRCDVRGVRDSTGNYGTATQDDFVEDGLAELAYLRSRSEVDQSKIGLLGHSEGGVKASRMAARSPDVAFVIMLASPGLPIPEVMARQMAEVYRRKGVEESLLSKLTDWQQDVFKSLVAVTDDDARRQLVARKVQEGADNFSPAEKAKLGITPELVQQQIKTVGAPSFRSFLLNDPQVFLRQLHMPVLALNGEKDVQVAAAENLHGIQATLEAAGNHRVKTQILPGLNHLFQTTTTGDPVEYGKLEETFSPTAVAAIVDWLKETAPP